MFLFLVNNLFWFIFRKVNYCTRQNRFSTEYIVSINFECLPSASKHDDSWLLSIGLSCIYLKTSKFFVEHNFKFLISISLWLEIVWWKYCFQFMIVESRIWCVIFILNYICWACFIVSLNEKPTLGNEAAAG